MESMNVSCKICSSKNIQEEYYGKIRSGEYGKWTKSDYSVYLCNNCKIRFLGRFKPDQFYESEEYRKEYNGSAKIEQYQALHDWQQNDRIHRIGIENFRNKVVADFGSGGCSFLDSVYGFASETIAIEPAVFFHNSIKKRHRVFSYGNELIEQRIEVDIATSFDVIEHVSQPVEFLQDIYKSLKPGGKVVISTDNFDNILNDLVPERYCQFNFRTAHLYYFNKDSMKYLMDMVGFKKYSIGFYHGLDISNLIYWLKLGQPTGKGKYQLFNEEFNHIYCNYLEKNGKASELWVEGIK